MIAWIITSSVLIAVVITLRLLFRGKLSRRLQYALWGLVLLRLMMPFSLLETPVSVMNIVPDSSLGEKQVYVLPLSKQPVSETPGIVFNNTGAVIDVNSFGYSVLSANGETITRYAQKLTVGEIFGLIWLIGGIAAGLWLIGTNLIFNRRIRQTRQGYLTADSPLPVYVSAQIASPCLFGIIRPAVYLTPKAIETEDNVHYALVHELCHYRQGDHLWSILRCLCLAAWWWNPLVWAASVLSREDSELACDEAVIKWIGNENRLAYGRALVDMITVRKAPAALLCATTSMVSGKQSLKGRLNLIVKSPRTVMPAMAAVGLIIAVCAVCTFTGAGNNTLNAQTQDLPAANMIFTSQNTDLEQLGRDAAAFYYTQFTKDDVPQYWHITKYNILSSKLMAGDKAEFAVWITTYIETNGAGLLTGEGIPYDNDINKGGICPEVGRQFRMKSLAGNRYEIVSIGTGGGDQGLTPAESTSSDSASYALFRLENGKVLSALSPLSGDAAHLAEDTVMNYLVKSAAWPGTDIKTLDDCYLLRATYSDGTMTDYYAYLLNDKAVMQMGQDGYYSISDNQLYERLVKLAESGTATGNSINGPTGITVGIDRTDLNTCVSGAILTANANLYKSSDFAAEAYTILKTVSKGNITTVYAMALYQEFSYSGNGLTETGGSHMPVAVTFEKNAAGEYELKEYWMPKEGDQYSPSIKAKFPADIYADALDTQKYSVAHIQACYKQAIEYGKADTTIEIAKLITTITSSPAYMSNPSAYIEAHQVEYRELIYFGEYTLRYCFTRFEQGGQTGLEGHIMAAACREIMGKAEDIDRLANTGQDWYDAFKQSALDLKREYGETDIQKNRPGSWLLLKILGE